jgi:hypothetical protein
MRLSTERNQERERALQQRVQELEAEYQRRGRLTREELTDFPDEVNEESHLGDPDPLGIAVRRLERLANITGDCPWPRREAAPDAPLGQRRLTCVPFETVKAPSRDLQAC